MKEPKPCGFSWLWSLILVAVSLWLARLLWMESWGVFFCQAGALALGIVLESAAVLLAKWRGVKWFQFAPLVLLAFPWGGAMWELMVPSRGFLGGSVTAFFYFLPGLHYLMGWEAVYLLFREKKDGEERKGAGGH